MEKSVIVRWTIKKGNTDRVLALLPELVEKTRGEPGNVLYAIFQAEANPNELILCESYVDADAAAAHRASEHYRRIVAEQIVPCLESREVTPAARLA